MSRGRIGTMLGLAAVLAGAAMLTSWSGSGVLPDAAAAPDAPARVPQRIVSLNLCSDQMLLDLVPRDRIAGLSTLVADRALSGRVDAAAGIPLLRGHAEEVLALRPDLVIAGAYSTPATVGLLRRLGVNVVQVPLPADFAGIREAVRVVASAVGADDRGAEMIARFDRRIAAAREASRGEAVQGRPAAIVYHVNSLASGSGSLLDEIVRTAGFRNAAAGMRLGPADRLPLETLVMEAPELLVRATAADTYRTPLADNLRHPALAAVARRRAAVHLPPPLWMCGTPDVAEAVELLADARRQWTDRGPRS